MFGVLASLSPKQPIAGFKSSTQMSKMFGVFAEQNDVNCKANKKTNREKMFFTKISTWVIVGAWRSFPHCNQISFRKFQLLAPTSSEIVIPPTTGNVMFSGGQLWYVPEGPGTAGAFVVVFNSGGRDVFLTQLIDGENTSSTLSFAVSTQDGSCNIASPDGDCADYIFVDDIWYKIMGPIHGHCFINPSGPPTCTDGEVLDDGGVGLVVDPLPLTPVAPGQFIPPEPWWISIGWGE
jgi:hypothetical protein